MKQRAYPLREDEPALVERVRWLRKRLLTWFRRNGRSFPWREPDRSPYEIVVSEILLQRTTAAGVARAYPAFIGRYPSWAALVHASPENLALSLEEGAGALPDSRAALERLPGIGPYTASTVLAIVHGRAEPLVDVNMARLLGRFFELPRDASSSDQRALHELGLRLVKGKRSLQVNWAVLDFAALVCRARRPLCPQCPLRARCQYRALKPSLTTPTPGASSGSRSAGGR